MASFESIYICNNKICVTGIKLDIRSILFVFHSIYKKFSYIDIFDIDFEISYQYNSKLDIIIKNKDLLPSNINYISISKTNIIFFTKNDIDQDIKKYIKNICIDLFSNEFNGFIKFNNIIEDDNYEMILNTNKFIEVKKNNHNIVFPIYNVPFKNCNIKILQNKIIFKLEDMFALLNFIRKNPNLFDNKSSIFLKYENDTLFLNKGFNLKSNINKIIIKDNYEKIKFNKIQSLLTFLNINKNSK